MSKYSSKKKQKYTTSDFDYATHGHKFFPKESTIKTREQLAQVWRTDAEFRQKVVEYATSRGWQDEIAVEKFCTENVRIKGFLFYDYCGRDPGMMFAAADFYGREEESIDEDE